MTVESMRKERHPCNLDELCGSVSVMSYEDWKFEINHGPENWWAVVEDDGIIAYFMEEHDALRFRLDYINRILNP